MIEKKELYIAKKVKQNFKFEISKRNKYAISLSSSDDKINKEEIKSNFDFMKNNLKNKTFEMTLSVLSIISICISAFFCLFNIISGRDILHILSSFSFSLIFTFPILLPFALSLKMYSFIKKAIKKGIMLFNPETINTAAKLKTLTIQSNDLYPNGNVILKEIKTFHGQRIDEAILRQPQKVH